MRRLEDRDTPIDGEPKSEYSHNGIWSSWKAYCRDMKMLT